MPDCIQSFLELAHAVFLVCYVMFLKLYDSQFYGTQTSHWPEVMIFFFLFCTIMTSNIKAYK